MKRKRVAEILEFDISKIENNEIKLLFGDMEMCFDMLNNLINWDTESNKFYQCYGEVNTFLNCLHCLGIFTEEQVQTMKIVLKDIEYERESKGFKKVKKHGYNYCPHCGTALN